MAWSVEPAVVTTSSTITTRVPAGGHPSIFRPVPWSLISLRTRNARRGGALDVAEGGHGADDRVRPQGQTSDGLGLDTCLADAAEDQARGEPGALRQQGGLLGVEVVAALPPRGERKVPEHQGLGAQQIPQAFALARVSSIGVVFVIDRPFLFLLTQRKGTIMFQRV
jgi:hypothetical protein